MTKDQGKVATCGGRGWTQVGGRKNRLQSRTHSPDSKNKKAGRGTGPLEKGERAGAYAPGAVGGGLVFVMLCVSSVMSRWMAGPSAFFGTVA